MHQHHTWVSECFVGGMLVAVLVVVVGESLVLFRVAASNVPLPSGGRFFVWLRGMLECTGMCRIAQ